MRFSPFFPFFPPILLAESATTFTAGQLGAAIGILLLALSVIVAWRKVFNQDPPLYKEYVTRTQHDKDQAETWAELKRHAARRAEIYEEQKRQGEKLARLEVATQQQTEDLGTIKDQIADANERINAVPERTISLLLDAQKLSDRR